MEKLGFIGMGNMAQALAAGFVKSEKISKNDIFAFAPNQQKLQNNATIIGFNPTTSVESLVKTCDTLVMACKPYQIEGVLSQICPSPEKNLLKGKALISVAAGWDFQKYLDTFTKLGLKVSDLPRLQFVMPNTPAMVGEGVLLFEVKNTLEAAERTAIMELFASTGLVQELPSNLMGIGGAVTGCGPAFVDLMIESYADSAVKYGIPRKDAYRLVSQMILGSAKLQLATGEHPAVLKDNVCSPAGTTIRGVAALEESGFRHACQASIDAIIDFKNK